MDFRKQNEIINNKSTHLAAICQTAIHGWHGIVSVNDECTAREIADAIGVDFVFTYKWYHDHPYKMPDMVIEKVKEAAANGSLNDILNIHPTELAYPPAWLIAEFSK